MSRPDEPKAYTPTEIDDIEDRMGSVHELNFSDRLDDRQGRVGDERPEREVEQEFPEERVRQSGLTGGEALTDSLHEDGVTDDDLSPDTLLDETGARDPHEPGDGGPADQALTEKDAIEIGGGRGLDEAELARTNPLDGKPWTDDTIEEDERS